MLSVAAVPLAAVALLAGEVQAARGGGRLADVELTYAGAGSRTAVWIGDSTAFGTGVTDGADAVASAVARARGERVVMLAVPGATVADVVAEQLPRVAGERPDVVYVSVGANDVTHLTSVSSFRSDYRRLLAGLPPAGAVVVLGVPDMGAPTRLAQPLRAIAGWRGRRLDRVVRTLAGGRRSTTYVDIEGRTGPSFRRDPDHLFAADRYHPSPAGYRTWTDAVLRTVGA
jgi:lysophospholipase L1-like esterase